MADPGGYRGARESGVRLDVQALRAVAIGAVLVFHSVPQWLPGGFVGVDIFFVISGYLIGGLLLRQLRDSGRINYGQFLLRRIRRLLPAALTVIVSVAIAAWLILPKLERPILLQDLLASLFYVENWALAARSVDYLQAQAAASVYQHFWSLSVEEQFYITLPLVLVGVGVFAKSVRLSATRTALTFITVLAVASLVYCVWLSYAAPQTAYFSTVARAWEFLAGVIIAGIRGRFAVRSVAAAGWVLLVGGILVCGFVEPFPGWIVLVPTTGTALVLAGAPGRTSLRIMSTTPVQWVGDHSYSLYLWHWPALLLVPLLLPIGYSALAVALAIGASLFLAFVTRRWVELRYWQPSGSPRRARTRSYAVSAGLLTVGLVIASVGIVANDADIRRQYLDWQSYAESASACYGLEVLEPGCTRSTQTPPYSTELANADAGLVWSNLDPERDCAESHSSSGWVEYDCTVERRDARSTVALVGDSHAAQWADSVAEAAREKGMNVRVLHRGACPLLDASSLELGASRLAGECQAWSARAMTTILGDPSISTVVVSMWAYSYRRDVASSDWQRDLAAAYAATMSRLADAGKSVVVVRDTPYPRRSIPSCLAADANAVCDFMLDADTVDNVSTAAVAVANSSAVQLLDLTPLLCDEKSVCHARSGGVIMYRDASHLTGWAARSASARFAAVLAPLGTTRPH